MKAECKLGNIFSSAEQQKYCGLLKDLKHNCHKLKNIDSEVYVHVGDAEISVPIRRFIHSVLQNNLQIMLLVRKGHQYMITPSCNLMYNFAEFNTDEMKKFGKQCRCLDVDALKSDDFVRVLQMLGFDVSNNADLTIRFHT